MSHVIGILLALVSLAFTTCKALPDFHKQMSHQQLQSIFHVDTLDSVPAYEVVQLLHHDTQESAANQHHSHYRRRRRSIETHDLKQKADSDHVKKDLSKNSYYSEIKEKNAEYLSTNSVYDTKSIDDIKEHKVSFNAFGKDINLTLKQTGGLFKNGQVQHLPMWYVDNEANATHGLNLQKIEDEFDHSSDNVGQVFQDEDNMAAILMRRHEVTGDLIMEGSIGQDMVIKPLPHDLTPHKKASHHVIFKREVDHSEHLGDFAFMEPDDLATSEKLDGLQNRPKRASHQNTLVDLELEEEQLEAAEGMENSDHSTHKRTKRQAPFIIYPEILVIVDYDGYRLHGGDNLQVKRYFISFWNGVDLRYRLLKGPKIRISIAGIIISRGRDATPYLERNRVGRDAIDSAAALTDMGKYLFRERRLPVYDIAVAITKYDMCRRRKGGRCTKGTAGFAYVGGACVVNKRLEKVNSVAIIEDTGGFSGIIVAAHEVGHLLGAVHDGSPPPSYLGGPGAKRCRWEDGYIMSDLRHTERGFRWSPCTVQSFHHFLNGDTATCLYNAPHEDSALGRSLPGTLLSLDAQCGRDRGTYACFKDERVCAQLFCFDAQTGYCVAYRPAAEGSPCGNNLHCLDGGCTPLLSNIIPNYGKQYVLGYKHNGASKDISKIKDYDEENEDNEEDDEDEEVSDEEEEDEEEDENNDDDSNENSNYSDSANAANDDEDDEQYLTEYFNEYNTSINKNKNINLRNDNNLDSTSLKVSEDNKNSLKQTKYNTNTNIDTIQNTNLFNLNTYLAQLLQNLQTTTATISTTATSTTKRPSMIGHTGKQVQLQSNKQGLRHVVIKTSTKSSVSSSTRSSRKDTITQQHQTPHNTLDITTATLPPSTPTSTLFKSLSKQFQYYLKLLQQNNSHNNSRINNNNQNYNRQTILPSKPYSNSLQNAVVEDNAHQELNEEDDSDDNDEEEGDNGGNNGGVDNDESNEAIEKLKRKLSIPLTTKSLQLQQQLQQQLTATGLPPTTTSYLATATPRYGSKSTYSPNSPVRSSLATSTYTDNYFNRMQNQKPTKNAGDIFKTNENKTKLKLTKSVEKQQNEDGKTANEEDNTVNNFEAQFLKRTPENPSTKEDDNDNYSSSSLNTNNPYFLTKSTIPGTATKRTSTTRSINNNNNKNSYNNRRNNYNDNNEQIQTILATPIATQPQTPIYVTNYIGDNTQQRLTTIKHQQQQIQQDTTATMSLQQSTSKKSKSSATQSPPTPPPSPLANHQQFETFHSLSSTTRRPKFKTQKLIRRLRTQIK